MIKIKKICVLRVTTKFKKPKRDLKVKKEVFQITIYHWFFLFVI